MKLYRDFWSNKVNKKTILVFLFTNFLLFITLYILLSLFSMWFSNQSNLLSVLFLWRTSRWARILLPLIIDYSYFDKVIIDWFWERYKKSWSKNDSEYTRNRYKTYEQIREFVENYDEEDTRNPIHPGADDIIEAWALKVILIFLEPITIKLKFIKKLPLWVEMSLPCVEAYSIVPLLLTLWCIGIIREDTSLFPTSMSIFSLYWVLRTVVNMINPFGINNQGPPSNSEREQHGERKDNNKK